MTTHTGTTPAFYYKNIIANPIAHIEGYKKTLNMTVIKHAYVVPVSIKGHSKPIIDQDYMLYYESRRKVIDQWTISKYNVFLVGWSGIPNIVRNRLQLISFETLLFIMLPQLVTYTDMTGVVYTWVGFVIRTQDVI